jgi:hypothetical protein
MGTQGMITLVRKSEVVRKIVVGCSGMEVPLMAAELRKNPTDDPAALVRMAGEFGVGCDGCLVVQTAPASFVLPDGFAFEQDDKDFHRWRDTFTNPKFNPRWDNGTVEYLEIVQLPISNAVPPSAGDGEAKVPDATTASQGAVPDDV